MTNTVASSQWSLSQGNFRRLLSSSVMHIELLFTMILNLLPPISSSTCSLFVIMFLINTIFLEFISSFTPYGDFKILFYFTIFIIISKIKNYFTDIWSVKVFHSGLIQQPERLYLGSLHPVADTAFSSSAAAWPV